VVQNLSLDPRLKTTLFHAPGLIATCVAHAKSASSDQVAAAAFTIFGNLALAEELRGPMCTTPGLVPACVARIWSDMTMAPASPTVVYTALMVLDMLADVADNLPRLRNTPRLQETCAARAVSGPLSQTAHLAARVASKVSGRAVW